MDEMGQTPDKRPIGSGDERTDRRQELELLAWLEEMMMNEDLDSGVSEEGEISDYDEPYARAVLQQQLGLSDVEARTPDRSGSESKRVLDEETQGRHELVQSSVYPIRPNEENCQFYVRTGKCGYGSDCRFNHPEEFQDKAPGPKLDCKYFKLGACKYGSICIFHHPRDRDVPRLPKPQVRTPDLRPSDSRRWFDMRTDRRQETESKSWLDKRVRSPDWRASESNELASGFKRAREIPMSPRVNAQENLWNRRQRNIERQRREAQEDLQEQGEWQSRNGQENLLEQRDNNIERQRRIAEENLQQQRLEDMPENHIVDDQQNQQEQRQRNIEQERREARLRLDQIRPTVLFDELSRPKELMKEFGFKDLEDPRLQTRWK